MDDLTHEATNAADPTLVAGGSHLPLLAVGAGVGIVGLIALPATRALGYVLGGVGAVAGAVYLYVLATKKPEDPICEALGKLGVPGGKAVCDALGGLSGILSGIGSVGGAVADAIGHTEADEKRDQADNVKLNGAAAVPMDRIQRATFVQMFRGDIIEHTNGCQPFAGAWGWSKCAPGTHDMSYGNIPYHDWVNGNLVARFHEAEGTERIAPGSGRAGDPFSSGPWIPGAAVPSMSIGFDGALGGDMAKVPEGNHLAEILDGNGKVKQDAFPLPVPAGKALYYSKGRPFVCDPGGVAWNVRDHRNGQEGVAFCGGGFVGTDHPPTGYKPPSYTDTGTLTGNPPDGLTWDPGPPGHFRRLNVGETPHPAPDISTAPPPPGVTPLIILGAYRP